MNNRYGLSVSKAAIAVLAISVSGPAVLSATTQEQKRDAAHDESRKSACEELWAACLQDEVALLKAPNNVNYQTRAEVADLPRSPSTGATSEENDSTNQSALRKPDETEKEMAPVSHFTAP